MSKKHRALLAGCGGMSGAWLRALRDHFADRVELVGLVDLRPEAAIGRAREFGLGDCWTGASLDEALEATRPDLFFNCTIPEAHVTTSSAALRAGCHVLVEKPLAPTVREGEELVRLAEEMGRMCVVIQNRRYLPGSIAVRRCLESGAIGPVTSASVDFFLGPRFGGFREAMPHVLLLDMAIHTFDQCRQMLGRNAERVTCHEFNPGGSWFAHGSSAIALFEMEGGVPFSYRGSWCARGFNTEWAGSWRITGETGTLLWDGADRISLERVTAPWDGKTFMEPCERIEIPAATLAAHEREHAGLIGDFLRAVESGTPAQTAAVDNLRSLAMVEGAIRSAQDRATISII